MAEETTDHLLTAKNLSRRLGDVTAITIYRMGKAGLIPSVRVGAKLTGVRFSERAVREALSKLVNRSLGVEAQ